MTHEPGSWVVCHTYTARSPLLSLEFPSASVTVGCPDAEQVSAHDVVFARSLAAVAETYRAECERMYAAAGGVLDRDVPSSGQLEL